MKILIDNRYSGYCEKIVREVYNVPDDVYKRITDKYRNTVIFENEELGEIDPKTGLLMVGGKAEGASDLKDLILGEGIEASEEIEISNEFCDPFCQCVSVEVLTNQGKSLSGKVKQTTVDATNGRTTFGEPKKIVSIKEEILKIFGEKRSEFLFDATMRVHGPDIFIEQCGLYASTINKDKMPDGFYVIYGNEIIPFGEPETNDDYWKIFLRDAENVLCDDTVIRIDRKHRIVYRSRDNLKEKRTGAIPKHYIKIVKKFLNGIAHIGEHNGQCFIQVGLFTLGLPNNLLK